MKLITVSFLGLIFGLIGLASPTNGIPLPSGNAEGNGLIPPRQPSAMERARPPQQPRPDLELVTNRDGRTSEASLSMGALYEVLSEIAAHVPHPGNVPANTSNTRRIREERQRRVPARSSNTRRDRNEGSSSFTLEEMIALMQTSPIAIEVTNSLLDIESEDGNNNNDGSSAGNRSPTIQTVVRLGEVLREPGLLDSLNQANEAGGRPAVIRMLRYYFNARVQQLRPRP